MLDSKKSKNLVVLGEFNLNILEKSDEVFKYMTLLLLHGLTCFVNEPTRFSSDHIYGLFSSDEILSHCSKGNFDFQIRDHSMMAFLVEKVASNPVRK